MKKWEIALNKFLEQYINEDYVEGALVCGSFVSGNDNEFSDIDCHIFINNNQKWRHRGNVEVDGFLIEFFINPLEIAESYFEKDYNKNSFCMASMVGRGKIIADKNGQVFALQQKAKEYLAMEFKPIKDNDLQQRLYFIWDAFDEIKALKAKGFSINLLYNKLLELLMGVYFANNKIASIPHAKIEKVFADKDFAKKYGIIKMPNQNFIDLFLAALREQNIKNIESLHDFVINDCGGFDIKNFGIKENLRSEGV